ncbi:MAG: glycosyltransferase [Verrucomicrobiales bacterium]|nr:glycosyltransferase [Verrucomicrobiales bacterium]
MISERSNRNEQVVADEVTIAVVIVGRNSARFISEMMDSLVNQVDAPDEIIYYDDGSTDHSIEILEAYQKRLPQLEVISGQGHIGISAARNFSNSLVKSRFIAVLDSDDYFLPDTIARYRKSLRKDSDIALLYADTLVFRDGSSHVRRLRYPSFIDGAQATRCLMTRPVLPFKHSSVVYRKSAFDKIGGYCENLPLKVDYDLFVRFWKSGSKVRKLDAATSHHRTHSGQISKERIRGILLYWEIIDRHEPRFFYSFSFKLIRAFSEIAKLVLRR